MYLTMNHCMYLLKAKGKKVETYTVWLRATCTMSFASELKVAPKDITDCVHFLRGKKGKLRHHRVQSEVRPKIPCSSNLGRIGRKIRPPAYLQRVVIGIKFFFCPNHRPAFFSAPITDQLTSFSGNFGWVCCVWEVLWYRLPYYHCVCMWSQSWHLCTRFFCFSRTKGAPSSEGYSVPSSQVVLFRPRNLAISSIISI